MDSKNLISWLCYVSINKIVFSRNCHDLSNEQYCMFKFQETFFSFKLMPKNHQRFSYIQTTYFWNMNSWLCHVQRLLAAHKDRSHYGQKRKHQAPGNNCKIYLTSKIVTAYILQTLQKHVSSPDKTIEPCSGAHRKTNTQKNLP